MKNRMTLIALSAVALILVFVFGSSIYKSEEIKRLNFMAQENAKIFVPDHAPQLGSKSASVFLVEFLDPECESCRMFYPEVKKILSEYKDKVTLVIRYAPFHQNSKYAVKILEAARKQDKFWQVLELLFMYQPEWADHHNPKPEIVWKYLPETGVNIEKLRTDMNDQSIETIISQDIQDGQKLGVRATPSFFINGSPLREFNMQELRKQIDDELAKSK